MNYSAWVTAVNDLIQIVPANALTPASATPTGQVSFDAYIPTAIVNAETRLQRDLDLLNCYVTDSSSTLTAGMRQFTLPTDVGIFQVVSQVALIIGGVKQPAMTPVSRDYLAQVYPSDIIISTPSLPIYWCPRDQVSINVGPAPDAAYGVEIVGTQRLNPMSSTNTSNFLSINFPDLYLYSSMIEWSGFQRDYGSQSDDPKMALSWATLYQETLKSANVEEARKKFMSQGSSSRLPHPLTAQP